MSQLVILSLIHHLSNELDKLFELKLLWLEEAVAHLDVKVSREVFVAFVGNCFKVAYIKLLLL